MSFEEFEKIIMSCGEVKPCEGAANYGSDDWEVKLWRCYSNSNCCQVHQLYNALCKSIQMEKEKARLEGERAALLNIILKEKQYEKAQICEIS